MAKEMATLQQYIANVLWSATRGVLPEDDVLDPLPGDVHGWVRSAAARVAAHAMADDVRGADRERQASLRDLGGVLAGAHLSPGTPITRLIDEQALDKAAAGTTDLLVQQIIAAIPPTA